MLGPSASDGSCNLPVSRVISVAKPVQIDNAAGFCNDVNAAETSISDAIPVKRGRWGNQLVMVSPSAAAASDVTSQPRVQYPEPLAPRPIMELSSREIANSHAIGGMRCPRHAVNKCPGVKATGAELGLIVHNFLQLHMGLVDEVHQSVGHSGSALEEIDCLHPLLQELRLEISDFLGSEDVAPVQGPVYRTPMRAKMWQAWCVKSDDPDRCSAWWLSNGAPAGVRQSIPQDGFFSLHRRQRRSRSGRRVGTQRC